jgi:hypothetical protein
LHGEPRHLAAAYAGCIELAISRRERSDACWRGFATGALAECVSETNPLIETWAELRARGQHLMRQRRLIAA